MSISDYTVQKLGKAIQDGLEYIGDKIIEPYYGSSANLPAETIQQGLETLARSAYDPRAAEAIESGLIEISNSLDRIAIQMERANNGKGY